MDNRTEGAFKFNETHRHIPAGEELIDRVYNVFKMISPDIIFLAKSIEFSRMLLLLKIHFSLFWMIYLLDMNILYKKSAEFQIVLHPKSWTQDWRCSFYEQINKRR